MQFNDTKVPPAPTPSRAKQRGGSQQPTSQIAPFTSQGEGGVSRAEPAAAEPATSADPNAHLN